uniref:Uncharacterized protein n=1 Tax=Arundo donax TaxID=35708 RepID=A0A0A9FTJ6_ARUDO
MVAVLYRRIMMAA